ncbi:MAG: hypothetical protein HZC51_03950 [Nitrospirae bacterium]|nr:hypothetical protein [Nitrospirota bacterium]
MNTSDALNLLLLGALLGAIGQGARVIVGLKKMNDEAAATGLQAKDLFVTNQLVISLLIGGIAGSIASLFYLGDCGSPDKCIDKELMFTLFAAGYAGADFIEGFMATRMAKLTGGTTGGGTAGADATSVITTNSKRTVELPDDAN